MYPTRLLTPILTLVACTAGVAASPPQPTRCEVVPLPHHQTSLRIDGVEKARWHFGPDHAGPFFFPLRSPAGGVLTRMGHPGAPNHDHHRSIWFAHYDVEGIDFWSMRGTGQIRQKAWYCYVDDDQQAIMATDLGWFDASGTEVMQQDTVAVLLPMPDGEHALELQITLRPAGRRPSVQLGTTNFGILAVRVAKTVSTHFGGGQLSDSEGRRGEPAIFGNSARWMDYSGPVVADHGGRRAAAIEGITFFDHPDNPRYPTAWHVREDGWMGAAFCLNEGYTVEAERPLRLRYLLHAHRGGYDQAAAASVHQQFAARPPLEVAKSTKRHQQYEVVPGASSATSTD